MLYYADLLDVGEGQDEVYSEYYPQTLTYTSIYVYVYIEILYIVFWDRIPSH